jgi:hypothetical protein
VVMIVVVVIVVVMVVFVTNKVRGPGVVDVAVVGGADHERLAALKVDELGLGIIGTSTDFTHRPPRIP